MQPAIISVIPQDEGYLASSFLFFWFPSQLPIFLAGFIVYFCSHNGTLTRFVAAPGRALLLMVMAIFTLLGLTRMNSGLIPIHVLYSAVFSVLIVSLSVKPFTIIVNAATCGLGVLSFSCYITHFAALRVIGHFIKSDAFAALPARFAPVCQFLVIWVGALMLTAAASTVTYFCIEKPGIRLGSIIIKRLEASQRTNHTLQQIDAGGR